jgi:hypothetical protein
VSKNKNEKCQFLSEKLKMIQNTPNNHGRSDQNIIIKVLSAPFLFLSLLFAHLNYLAILSGLENGVDSIVSKLLKNVIGFNVEFPVHGSGRNQMSWDAKYI